MCYFGSIMTMTDSVVDCISHELHNPIFGRVDLIVGIGLSGTMPLVPVYRRSGIDICAMRKKGVSSHGGSYAMSTCLGDSIRYLILDDFSASGRTLDRVYDRLKTLHRTWECAGVILYEQDSDHTAFTAAPVRGLGWDVVQVEELRAEEVQGRLQNALRNIDQGNLNLPF